MQRMQRAIWILWPSFLVAGAAEMITFTLLDPSEMVFDGVPYTGSRMLLYSLGFVFLWATAAASSAFTCWLQRTAAEINRCPLTPVDRPVGCPKREEPEPCCD